MAEAGYMKLSIEGGDVAVLTLDDPRGSANVLSRAVLDELDKHLTALEARKDLAGLVIRSGKPGVFIVGADIREFLAGIDMPKDQIVEMCNRGRKLFQRLSKMPFVTVAAIDGMCVGGGAELAMWCDRRVMSSDAQGDVRLSGSEAGLVSRLGRHGAHAAHGRAVQRRGDGHQRRIDRRQGRRRDGPGLRPCAGR